MFIIVQYLTYCQRQKTDVSNSQSQHNQQMDGSIEPGKECKCRI